MQLVLQGRGCRAGQVLRTHMTEIDVLALVVRAATTHPQPQYN